MTAFYQGCKAADDGQTNFIFLPFPY